MTDSLLVRQNALLFWGVVGVLLALAADRGEQPAEDGMYSGTQSRSLARAPRRHRGAGVVEPGPAARRAARRSAARAPGRRAAWGAASAASFGVGEQLLEQLLARAQAGVLDADVVLRRSPTAGSSGARARRS